MLKRIFRHIFRQPLSALAVVLFAGVLSTVLCYLHLSGIQEQISYAETYASVPVTFRVTDLDGSKPKFIEGWIVDLFSDRGIEPNFAPYVDELYVRTSRKGNCYYTLVDENGIPRDIANYMNVAGICSLRVAEELSEKWGGQVHWYDGYDESILATEEAVCLVPESMKDAPEVKLAFEYVKHYANGKTDRLSKEMTLKVAGYYVDKGNSRIYCPYELIRQVYTAFNLSKEIEELCAVLNDNANLAALKETAALWFAKPNPAGNKTEWGRFGYDHYLYAMDIDDTMLTNLEYSMKNSMRLNQLASAVIFVLSAGAGFLTGFLVIRSRKREISLMRMMGGGQVSIFTELALEQLCCIALGILVGGSYSMWQPVDRLALFGVIYFVGLSVALIVFLRKNLLSGSKEDE